MVAMGTEINRLERMLVVCREAMRIHGLSRHYPVNQRALDIEYNRIVKGEKQRKSIILPWYKRIFRRRS